MKAVRKGSSFGRTLFDEYTGATLGSTSSGTPIHISKSIGSAKICRQYSPKLSTPESRRTTSSTKNPKVRG